MKIATIRTASLPAGTYEVHYQPKDKRRFDFFRRVTTAEDVIDCILELGDFPTVKTMLLHVSEDR